MRPDQFVPLIVGIPLGTAAILAGTGSLLPRRIVDSLAVFATVLSGTSATIVFGHSLHQPIVYWFGGWYPRNGIALGISFYADPIAAILTVLAALLTLMGFVFSWEYFESAGSLYHALMLLLSGSICGFLLSADLFNLFVFLELSTVAAVALSGYHSDSPGPLQGAWNFGIIGTVGSVLALTGIALVYGRTGALNFAQAGSALSGHPNPLVVVAFAFIACGVLVKAGVVPFHFWLSDAHAVAATPACVMFSGIMVEMAVVAVLRIYFVVFSTALGDREWAVRAVLCGFGTITAVLGAIMCLLQSHLKRLLAYSTISHVGLVLLAASLFVPGAVGGAVLYVMAHGLVKGALFLCAGALKQRFDAIEEGELHGKARGWYSLLIIYVLAAIGLASAPPFVGGRADGLIVLAARAHGADWVEWMFVLAAIVTVGAILRSAGSIFFGLGAVEKRKGQSGGGEREAKQRGRRVEVVMLAPAAVLVLVAAGLTFTPGLDRLAHRAGADFVEGSRVRTRILLAGALPLASPSAEAEHREETEPLTERFGVTTGGMNLFFALIVAGLALERKRLNFLGHAVVRRPVELLRRVHSGAVGDYAAWFTVGVAVATVTLLVCFRT